ncbi:betaC-S lyase [Streptococcus anginosus]|nr:betaC-S lyase [Streptococcus anginosus]
MSKYNFQTAPNRLSHHTYKWKETETDPHYYQHGLQIWTLKLCRK